MHVTLALRSALLMSSIPPPSATLVAGKYRLVREIGRGGMGSVWEGQHASLGTRVAIKFIDASYADSQEARQRFDNEARATARLQSKHAIQIFDHGITDDGRPYIVMELLEGEPLDRRLERVGRLSLADTTQILLQVCRGLGRAHERGIVHRDLKPENIYLVRTEEDDDEVAKILDFGIAKMRTQEGVTGLTSGTKTGAVLGTPYFMSPEQARGLKEIDHRTDLWSLGIIAYKCTVGVLPFEGQAVGDLLVKICTAPAPVPSHSVPSLPPAFDAWFARSMEREPDRRFQSVAELADGLAYAAGIAVRGASRISSAAGAPAYHPAPYANTPNTPNPAMAPAGPAVTSSPLTTSMMGSGLPRKRHGVVWAVVAVAVLGAAAGVATLMVRQRNVQDAAVREQESRTAAIARSATAAETEPPRQVASGMPPVLGDTADAGALAPGSGNDGATVTTTTKTAGKPGTHAKSGGATGPGAGNSPMPVAPPPATPLPHAAPAQPTNKATDNPGF